MMKLYLLIFFNVLVGAKIYDRCELARELKFVLEAPSHQVATWVCIAEHESQYNTSIVGHMSGDGSGDHGIFQINDKFWCSPPGKGYACGLSCSDLEDDDISDDFICAQRIYKEHKTLSGDGFNAWAVYKPHCKGSKAERYIKDCFNDIEASKPFGNDFSTSPPIFAHGFFGTADGAYKGISKTTEKSSFNALYNPTSTTYFTPSISNSPLFNPTTSTRFVPITNEPTSLFINNNNPPQRTFTNFAPLNSRFSFFTPTTSTVSVFTPTTTPVYRSSEPNSIANEPIFIFNGVKWY